MASQKSLPIASAINGKGGRPYYHRTCRIRRVTDNGLKLVELAEGVSFDELYKKRQRLLLNKLVA